MEELKNHIQKLQAGKFYGLASSESGSLDFLLLLLISVMDEDQTISVLDYHKRRMSFTQMYYNFFLMGQGELMAKYPNLQKLKDKLDLSIPIQKKKRYQFHEDLPYYAPYIFDQFQNSILGIHRIVIINDLTEFLNRKLIDDPEERNWIIKEFQRIAKEMSIVILLCMNTGWTNQTEDAMPPSLNAFKWSRNLVNSMEDIFYFDVPSEENPNSFEGDEQFRYFDSSPAELYSLKSMNHLSWKVEDYSSDLINNVITSNLNIDILKEL